MHDVRNRGKSASGGANKASIRLICDECLRLHCRLRFGRLDDGPEEGRQGETGHKSSTGKVCSKLVKNRQTVCRRI